ncbi:MAG: lipid-binding SYLF domain-containing protein [Halioglobus sp.]|nr:lipid-binding SYLF domain-containing protein [Halioglobus sp.]
MSRLFTLVFLMPLLWLLSAPVAASSYSDAIRSFSNAGESGDYFKTAYGYAIFPTIAKAGIGLGGAFGEGRVYIGAQHVGNVTMSQVTLGMQLGGQAYSQIIFFQHEQAFRDFTESNFEFSAQATAVAITAGATAEANTGGGVAAGISGGRNDAATRHGGYRKGMAVFTIARGGLMFEAALGGQKFKYLPLNPASAPAASVPGALEPAPAISPGRPVP